MGFLAAAFLFLVEAYGGNEEDCKSKKILHGKL